MIRATTPRHTFIFQDDPNETFEKLLITYSQDGTIILEKTKDDMEFGSETDDDGATVYTASVRLSQQETNLFYADHKSTVDVQVRGLTFNGEAIASEITTITLYNVLNDEVLR